MEDTSLDSDQLRKGRRYANSGQVGTITISPGRIATTVHAPEDTYESAVLVDRLSEDEWRRFLDQVGAQAGHIAALLDGEMPHELVEAAADAGVPLLPGIGDLDPSCTCDGWELPCQHAAALCYQVGWLLDDDPFVLLLMRGRSRDDLLDELLRRMASSPAEPAVTLPGVPAADVFGTPGSGAAGSGGTGLPELPDLPGKVDVEDLVVSGIDLLPELAPGTLRLLAQDAARRARAQLSALLSGSADPWLLDEWQDAVRLAADYPALAERLTTAFDRPTDLAVGVKAWSYGGAPGLDALEHSWEPNPSELARARTELLAALDDHYPDPDGGFAMEANRLTSAERQLRLDRVGRWHPYDLIDGAWVPAGPADRDPTAAFAVQDG